MTNKRSLDTITKLLDALSMNPTLAAATRAAGITTMTLLRWTRLSEKGDPEFSNVTYGDITQPLHLHLADCKAVALATLEGNFVDAQTNGYWAEVWYAGQRRYEDDEQLVKLGWKFCEEMGLPDMKKRDSAGNRIPCKMWVAPTTEGILGILRPRHPDYRDQRHVSISGNVGLGVRVLGTPRNKPVPVEIVGEVVKELVHHEEADMSDLIGDEQPETVVAADVGKGETATAAPIAPATPANPLQDQIDRLEARPMSPMLRDAIAKLRAKQAAAKTTPPTQRIRPPPSSASATDQDDCRPLAPGAGGFKVS